MLVQDTKFLANQNGLMSANEPNIRIRVEGSRLIGNGQCRPTRARIYADHHTRSRAELSEIVGYHIQGGPAGNTSFLLELPNGGSVSIEYIQMSKGKLT